MVEAFNEAITKAGDGVFYIVLFSHAVVLVGGVVLGFVLGLTGKLANDYNHLKARTFEEDNS